MTNNDTTETNNDWATRTHLQTWVEFMCSSRRLSRFNSLLTGMDKIMPVTHHQS